MAMRELVVAHYRGDLNWLKNGDITSLFDTITIYHKLGCGATNEDVIFAPPLVVNHVFLDDNVGREAQTYLYHILRRYADNSIAQKHTVFAQDGFADKLSLKNFVRICKGEALINHISVDTPWEEQLCQTFPSYLGTPMHPVGCTQLDFFRKYIDASVNTTTPIPWLNGAYIVATREEIQRRDISVYRHLFEAASNNVNPEIAFLMERAWYVLFKKPTSECSLVHPHSV
jgi:hypothetical protein